MLCLDFFLEFFFLGFFSVLLSSFFPLCGSEAVGKGGSTVGFVLAMLLYHFLDFSSLSCLNVWPTAQRAGSYFFRGVFDFATASTMPFVSPETPTGQQRHCHALWCPSPSVARPVGSQERHGDRRNGMGPRNGYEADEWNGRGYGFGIPGMAGCPPGMPKVAGIATDPRKSPEGRNPKHSKRNQRSALVAVGSCKYGRACVQKQLHHIRCPQSRPTRQTRPETSTAQKLLATLAQSKRVGLEKIFNKCQLCSAPVLSGTKSKRNSIVWACVALFIWIFSAVTWFSHGQRVKLRVFQIAVADAKENRTNLFGNGLGNCLLGRFRQMPKCSSS